MPKAVQEQGATTYASLSVLSDQLVQQASHEQSRCHIMIVSKNVVVVTLPGTPRVGGANSGGAQEASQASEKLPYCHCKSRAPSFIGETCKPAK